MPILTEYVIIYIYGIDFVKLFENKSVNDQVNILYEKIQEARDKYVKKIRTSAKKKLPWENDKDLINMKNKRRKARKRLNKSLNSDNQINLLAAFYLHIYLIFL